MVSLMQKQDETVNWNEQWKLHVDKYMIVLMHEMSTAFW